MPADAVEPVRQAPPPTPEAVAEIEAVTQHDVIAFLTAWADNTAPREAAAYVHFGMTSSDLLDTALALQLVEATDLLLAKADALVAALRDLALAHRGTLRVGRTHGIHAEPDVFGHRVADFAFAMARCRDRLRAARDGVAVGKISGAVGTYSNIDPAIEADGRAPRSGCSRAAWRPRWCCGTGSPSGSARSPISPRSARRSRWRSGTGSAPRCASCPSRSAAGQKGSSAMPHKKNPILSERICGLARIVRAQVVPVLEGMPLWHERDISHQLDRAGRAARRRDRHRLPAAPDHPAGRPGWSSTRRGCGPTWTPPAG